MKKLFGVLTAVVLMLLVVGCSGGSGKDLTDTSWKLKDSTSSVVAPMGSKITLEFDKDLAFGNSGVNTYRGDYTVDTAKGTLKFGMMAVTMMAGPDDAMKAESAYLKLIDEVKSYKATDKTLTLLDKDGTEILVFEPAAK